MNPIKKGEVESPIKWIANNKREDAVDFNLGSIIFNKMLANNTRQQLINNVNNESDFKWNQPYSGCSLNLSRGSIF